MSLINNSSNPLPLTTEEEVELKNLEENQPLTQKQTRRVDELRAKKLAASDSGSSTNVQVKANATLSERVKKIFSKIASFAKEGWNWVKRNESWIKPALIGIALLLGAAALIAAVIGSHGIFVFVIVGAAVAAAAIAFAIQMFITKPREDLQQERTSLQKDRTNFDDNCNTLKDLKLKLEKDLQDAYDRKLEVIDAFVKKTGDQKLKENVKQLCLGRKKDSVLLTNIEALVNSDDKRKAELEAWNNRQLKELNAEITDLQSRIKKTAVEYEAAKVALDTHKAKIAEAQKAIDAFAPTAKAKTKKTP